MDSRERTFLALDHQQPDRVPVDFWASAGLRERLPGEFDGLLDAHDVDLRYIAGPRYVGPPLAVHADGSECDLWGVRRRRVLVQAGAGTESYMEVCHSPLAGAQSPEEVEAYAGWPSPDWFDYRPVAAQCEAIRKCGRVIVFMGDRMNRIAQLKPAMYLRGMEQLMLDFALAPEIARAVIAGIRRFYRAYAERILDAARGGIDVVLAGDDFGSQNGPLLSPGMWTEFLGDGFAEYAGIVRAHGARLMHHTCGAVRPIVPLMLARGLDVLQSLQPEAAGMDARGLKTEFGDRLAFHGGISVQATLPFGTPDEVRRMVADRIDALAPGGGYILCTSHNIQADAPLENVDALLRAYRDFGGYA